MAEVPHFQVTIQVVLGIVRTDCRGVAQIYRTVLAQMLKEGIALWSLRRIYKVMLGQQPNWRLFYFLHCICTDTMLS